MTSDLKNARELVRLIEENPDLPVIVLNRQGDEFMDAGGMNARPPYYFGRIDSVGLDEHYDDPDGEWSVWKDDSGWEWDCYLDDREEMTDEEKAEVPLKRAIAVRIGCAE